MRLGIDLIKTDKIKNIINNPESAKKVFHAGEFSNNAETMAGIWAAKEAYFKAKGRKGDWLDIEVKKRGAGQPYIASHQNEEIHLSISHDSGFAVAVVVIE